MKLKKSNPSQCDTKSHTLNNHVMYLTNVPTFIHSTNPPVETHWGFSFFQIIPAKSNATKSIVAYTFYIFVVIFLRYSLRSYISTMKLWKILRHLIHMPNFQFYQFQVDQWMQTIYTSSLFSYNFLKILFIISWL